MKHVIVGGNGFVGRTLARQLIARNENVVVYDTHKSDLDIYQTAPFFRFDITDREAFTALDIGPNDVVYNTAARMLDPVLLRWKREAFLWPVNYTGVQYLLEHMMDRKCTKLVHFTTDMVYGYATTIPLNESHPHRPLGPYGVSKSRSEELCESYRARGMNISIFRPRLIIGPGRLGILRKLFWLVDHHLPVPMIGNGTNHYQFISVYDCASAAICAHCKGVPNSAYNLGSANPSSVKHLLNALINEACSKSVLLKTPGGLAKLALNALDFAGLPLMDPEQYLIADEDSIVDISRAARELDWMPRYRDEDMLIQAYREYRTAKYQERPPRDLSNSHRRRS
jgi:dTDP-glucose 4,6-dehydratase